MTLLLALALAAPAHPATALTECEVLAAVGRDYLALDRQLAPPLQPAGDYRPACGWKRLGLKGFAIEQDWPNGRTIFHRPKINGSTASVTFLIVYGRTSGQGTQCQLARRKRQWHVTSCTRRLAI
jgi:hypothetical protein